MQKVNESVNGMDNIGSSEKSEVMKYCSISEESKKSEHNDLELYKMIFYYQKKTFLIAMQIILLEKQHFPKLPNTPVHESLHHHFESTILGANPFSLMNTETVELYFDIGESMYLIEGEYMNDGITMLNMRTTYGQYITLGTTNKKATMFRWKFNKNYGLFDGFIIGWDERKINYVSPIVIQKREMFPKEDDKELYDISYEPLNYDN